MSALNKDELQEMLEAVGKRLKVAGPPKTAVGLAAKYEGAEDGLRQGLLELYWKSPLLGGRIKSLGYTQGRFKSLFDEMQLSADDDSGVLEVIQGVEDGSASMPVEYFEKFKDNIAHFQAKLTHSSASGAVFVSSKRVSTAPYLFSASIQGAGILLAVDQSKNDSSGQASRVIKVINGTAEDSLPYDSAIQAWHRSRTDTHEQGLERVDARLRQILLPLSDGYVALTPLFAGGISRLVRSAAKEKRVGGYMLVLPIGGSNVQNVSAIREVQNATFFQVPSRNRTLSFAISLLYRIYRVPFDRALLDAYVDWYIASPEYRQDRDSLKSRQIERASSLLYPLVHDAITSMVRDMSGIASVLGLLGEARLVAIDKAPALSRALFGRSFERKAEDEFVEQARRAIIRALKGKKVAYSEQADLRHDSVFREILRSRVQVEG